MIKNLVQIPLRIMHTVKSPAGRPVRARKKEFCSDIFAYITIVSPIMSIKIFVGKKSLSFKITLKKSKVPEEENVRFTFHIVIRL